MRAAFEVGFAQPDLAPARRAPSRHGASRRCARRRTSAMCSLPRPKRSTAPLSTKAIAWIGLLAERGRIARIDVAPRRHDRAVRLHDGGDALVPAFDDRAARDFDDDRALAHRRALQLDHRDIVLMLLGRRQHGRDEAVAPAAPAGAAICVVAQALHAVAAQQQPGVGRRAGGCPRRSGSAARPSRLRAACGAPGWCSASSRRQHAARDQGVDLRRHRMIGVQALELAVRHQKERRIADADPAHLVAAHQRRRPGWRPCRRVRAWPPRRLPTASLASCRPSASPPPCSTAWTKASTASLLATAPPA